MKPGGAPSLPRVEPLEVYEFHLSDSGGSPEPRRKLDAEEKNLGTCRSFSEGGSDLAQALQVTLRERLTRLGFPDRDHRSRRWCLRIVSRDDYVDLPFLSIGEQQSRRV